MQRVDGVQEVRVSLKDGLTILELKPGNRVTLSRLRQIIKNNGFVSKEAMLTAIGEEKTADGHHVFEVSGTGEQLTVASAPTRAGDAWRLIVAR